jgi:hypothetical protein
MIGGARAVMHNEEEFLFAIAESMNEEYRSI